MIILLNGSPRKNGATAGILQYISQQLKKQGMETTVVHFSDLHLRYCIGCCKCYETGACVYRDDIEELSAKIDGADGIIAETPTYASNVSGQLKTIIDRGHFVIEQLLYKKCAMSVVTYENYGGKDASKILDRLLLYSGAKISDSLCMKIPFSRSHQKDTILEISSTPSETAHVCRDSVGTHPWTQHKNIFPEVLSTSSGNADDRWYSMGTHPLLRHRDIIRIHRGILRFCRDVSGQRRFHLSPIKHFFIFRFGILPFVKRKGEGYAGVVRIWKKKGIHLS